MFILKMTRHFQTEIECLWSLQQISGTFNIVITVAWECIFLFWGWLYFCKLPAIYCNLLATPLFKSQTLQFIAGGWKRGKYENNARQKLVRTRNDWSFEARHQNRREDIIKMCFHSCRQWRRGWWRRWRLKSVGQLERKTCLERKQGCFEKVGEGLYYIYN